MHLYTPATKTLNGILCSANCVNFFFSLISFYIHGEMQSIRVFFKPFLLLLTACITRATAIWNTTFCLICLFCCFVFYTHGKTTANYSCVVSMLFFGCVHLCIRACDVIICSCVWIFISLGKHASIIEIIIGCLHSCTPATDMWNIIFCLVCLFCCCCCCLF